MNSQNVLPIPVDKMSSQQGQEFDYKMLNPQTQIFIQQQAKEIKSLLRRTAKDMIDIGQRLLEVKEQLGHGHFEAWLRSEFNWGHWTARKLMQVTRQFKSVNFTDLSIDASALYLLAAPSTPEIVRQEALKRATQGQVVTHSEVKALTSQYKELAKSKIHNNCTIEIRSETVDWVAPTVAEPCPEPQRIKVESTTSVEKSEHKLSKKNVATSEIYHISTHSHEQSLLFDGNDYRVKKQAEIKMRCPFELGDFVYINSLNQESNKCFGQVFAVREANTHELELRIKIFLDPNHVTS